VLVFGRQRYTLKVLECVLNTLPGVHCALLMGGGDSEEVLADCAAAGSPFNVILATPG
jgi:hypothetical protein